MKKIFVTILLALILVLYILRVYKVNTELSVKEEVIPYATEREVGHGEYMKVKEYTVLTSKEAKDKYDFEYDTDEDVKIYLVKVVYSNKARDKKMVDTRPVSVEKTGYTNATEMMFYGICNPFDLEFELKSGEEREVILPYILSAFEFTTAEWQKLEDEEFYLSTTRYPVKTKWKMK